MMRIGLDKSGQKAKTGTNTTDDVYNKWYDAVYEPQAEAVDTEDTSHTEEPQG